VHRAGPAVTTRPLRPFLASLLVGLLAVPPQAFAQPPSTQPPPVQPIQPLQPAPPVPPVQPVPYAPSQPVPYPGAPDPVVVNVPRAATPVGADVVYLKGGGMIRGTLIEAIPNDHATVDLGTTGQTAVIPWDRIERIDRGGVAPSAPPRAAAISPPPPPPGPEGSAVVHIEADVPVALDRREGRAWVFVCNAPCDEELPLSGTYRIQGAGVRNSGQFRLNGRPGDHVVLDVSTASKGGFVGGIVVAGVGVVVLLVGAMVLLTVASMDAADSAAGIANSSNDGSATTVGWVMLAGGAAATLVGVLVLTSNTRSKVDQATGVPRPRNDAWLRVPPWAQPGGRGDRAGAGLPKIVGVPIFETTF
jgi:hypothetical protein